MSRFIGESEAVRGVKRQIFNYRDAPGPVLILGESGTGKEIVARLIHDFSARGAKRFYPLNAGGIPQGMCESVLFGSVPGAFTGAVRKKGCFESADGGSLFIDEIGELDYIVQADFLRVLESGEVRRLGSNEEFITDVRLLTATNKDLEKAVRNGEFRKDLLLRIDAFRIEIPPLRERMEDIPDLLRHFGDELKSKRPGKSFEFTSSFVDRLYEHSWPGNVRELHNVFLRAVYQSETGLLTGDSIIFDELTD